MTTPPDTTLDYAKRARNIVGQWKYQGKGYDVTMPFSDHELNPLVSHIVEALREAHERGRQSVIAKIPTEEDFLQFVYADKRMHIDCYNWLRARLLK